MKEIFARIQKSILFIMGLVIAGNMIYVIYDYFKIRSARSDVIKELKMVLSESDKYKQGVGKNLERARDGTMLDINKYLYEEFARHALCLDKVLKNEYIEDDCSKSLEQKALSGDNTKQSIYKLRYSSDIWSGLILSLLALGIASLTLFLSWIFTGKILIKN